MFAVLKSSRLAALSMLVVVAATALGGCAEAVGDREANAPIRSNIAVTRYARVLPHAPVPSSPTLVVATAPLDNSHRQAGHWGHGTSARAR